jgi:hypothetical protein
MVLAYSKTGKQAPEKQQTKQAQKASNVRSQKKKADKLHNVSTLGFSTVHCRIFPWPSPKGEENSVPSHIPSFSF